MKNYTITVNGNVYDVTVEEGASTGTPVAAPKAAAPAPAAAPKADAIITVTDIIMVGLIPNRAAVSVLMDTARIGPGYFRARGNEDGERYCSSSGRNNRKY